MRRWPTRSLLAIKSLFCLIGISNHQTSALQCLNLLCQRHCLFGISHVYIQKMSRWVRCSYGKRAGFVGAKIDIFLLTNKFFDIFLPFLAPKVVSQALWKAILYSFFLDKAIQIPKYFVSLQCFRNNAEAQGWRLRDGNLYIGKALLDALTLTLGNLAVPKTVVMIKATMTSMDM